MKTLSILTLFLCSTVFLFAQDRPERLKINSDQDFAYMEGYLYQTFQDGKVISKDGTYGTAKFNFNRLTNEMLFIAPKGDTLKLLHPESTLMVTVASDSFVYHNNTFLRKVTHYNSAPDLFQKLEMEFVDNEKKTAYGYSSITSNNAVYAYAGKKTNTAYLDQDINMKYEQSKEMFLQNPKGDFVPAKEANFYKLFPKYKKELKAYLDEHNINFRKMKSVLQLVDYLQQLQAADPEKL